MTGEEGLAVMQTAIMIIATIAAPILLLSMVIGLVISIFQAATQINEQTLTFVPKLIIIGLVLFVAGTWMLQRLSDYTTTIFDLMQG